MLFFIVKLFIFCYYLFFFEIFLCCVHTLKHTQSSLTNTFIHFICTLIIFFIFSCTLIFSFFVCLKFFCHNKNYFLSHHKIYLFTHTHSHTHTQHIHNYHIIISLFSSFHINQNIFYFSFFSYFVFCMKIF